MSNRYRPTPYMQIVLQVLLYVLVLLYLAGCAPKDYSASHSAECLSCPYGYVMAVTTFGPPSERPNGTRQDLVYQIVCEPTGD